MADFILRTQSDRLRLLGAITGLDLEKPKKVSITEQDRSIEQNARLHAMLSDIAHQVEWHGQKFNITVWKRLCTAAWLREEGEQPLLVPALDGQGFDLIFERTSKLSVKKCAALITWIEAFGTEHQVRWTQSDNWNGRY